MKSVWLAALFCHFLILTACESTVNNPFRNAAPGPQGGEEGPFRRQRWLIPLPKQHLLMSATMWRPTGAAPRPLAVVGHASTEDEGLRIEDPTPRYEELALWLVRHGYVTLLPLRPGHSQTGGPYLEDQGGCDGADYLESGRATAVSIEAAVDYLSTQPFVRKDRAIVVGQSAGAWGALALAGHNPPAVAAAINFAGGRGGHSTAQPNSNCAPDRLVAAAGDFGKTARIPTLWIYTENDSFFGPTLSQRMADAFRRGGGRIEYHLLPPYGEEGHVLAVSPEATSIWGPIVEKFLAKL
jgi:dienelactone hydrolase